MRSVTLKQLRGLEAVVGAGSFVAAAERLALTPPAVTIQIRQLESAAGLPLLERRPDGVVATEAGREVLAAAERIERALADCRRALDALRDLRAGTVSVGIISTAKYFAPRALAAFRRENPGIELRILIGNRAEIIAALAEARVDVAIMGRVPEALDVTTTPLGPHPHVIIAAPDHPLAGRRGLAPQQLAGESFLLRESGSGTRGLMERLFAAQESLPRRMIEIGSNESIKQAVMAGLGIAFISAHTVAVELGDGRLVALDVAGLPVVREWYVVELADRRPMPAARSLAAFLADQGSAHLPELPGLGV